MENIGQIVAHFGEEALSNVDALNSFLASVERRALRMAELAVGDREEALDIVQESMMKLAEKYSHKPSIDWGPLFHCILQSRIRDWYRRNKVRNRIFAWLGKGEPRQDTDTIEDPIQQLPDLGAADPLQHLQVNRLGPVLMDAVSQLPLRQQQVFLLRAWEGLNTQQTAKAVGCAEGSVKTHYFRALQALRLALSEYNLESN